MRKIIYLFAAFVVLSLSACSIFGGNEKASFNSIRSEDIHSDNILLNQQGELLFTANLDANSVTIMNTATKKILAEIPVGREPVQLALSPDEDRLYVSCRYENKIDVISIESFEVMASIPVGIEPFGLVTSPDGRTLYVSEYRQNTIAIIDVKKEKVDRRIEVGDRPRTLALTASGEKLYVPHYLNGKISVVDTKEEKVSKTITLATSPNHPDPKKSQGIPNTLEQFVIAPDGKTAWVPHLLGNVDTPIHFEETIFPAISVIDLEQDVELIDERKELFEEINVQNSQNETFIVSNPYDVEFSENGKKAFVIMSGSEDLVVFNLARGGNATQVLRRITGNNPRGLVSAKTGEKLFIHNAMTHDIATVITGGDSSYSRAKLQGDNVKLISKDPLTPIIREGKTIFYSGNSDEFSADITGNNWMSCASCHSDGEINGLTFMTGKGQRNVPSNVLTTETGLFMWDGSRDDFTDYLLTVQGEMGGMMDYNPSEPLPQKVEAMYDALFAFLQNPSSFPPPQSPFKEEGELSDVAIEGRELFEGKGNCLACHGGATYTDSVLATNQSGELTTSVEEYLHNIGTANLFDVSSSGDARAKGANPRDGQSFDTPTLVGVWATPPYLHDGSAETIEESIQRHIYQEVPILSPGELLKIAEYVRTLD
ncbi:beta-propeller fold lactonase family protein [Bacillus sp. 2205SS5-2]|uniref:beta-propeller fold lactonase family protein n=1 Tax=Bacillus sp. 2205SS5-2 TaxID=3109031 RepID=UPI003005C2A2